jgi:hypothetical protein
VKLSSFLGIGNRAKEWVEFYRPREGMPLHSAVRGAGRLVRQNLNADLVSATTFNAGDRSVALPLYGPSSGHSF